MTSFLRPDEHQKAMRAYTASISYDRRLYRQDIAGSIAHARMLARQRIIADPEATEIVRGLGLVRDEIEAGTFPWREELEDIHANIEARLHELIGPVAGKLHTARSRNDQVATDMRLYVKEVARDTVRRVRTLQRAFLDLAAADQDVVLPGYTHLQRAQPVTLAHHLLAYVDMLERDAERFRQAHARTDVLPLGSGAIAGSPYPLDREWVAKELGFGRISTNSMDAVSDRDFLLDYQSAAALCMMHLSRFGEELVVWSSEEFAFVRMAEQYTTGSSLMPQKRNPDFAELGRGKTGRVYGHLVGLLTVLKGLPLTYNRDLQEDKEGFFDTVDTLATTLEVFAGMVSTLSVRKDRMRHAADNSYMLATDIADYLVAKGVPFRQAHHAVAELSKWAASEGRGFGGLALADYRRFSDRFEADVLTLTVDRAIAARAIPGGTAPPQVAEALIAARRRVEAGESL